MMAWRKASMFGGGDGMGRWLMGEMIVVVGVCWMMMDGMEMEMAGLLDIMS